MFRIASTYKKFFYCIITDTKFSCRTIKDFVFLRDSIISGIFLSLFSFICAFLFIIIFLF